MPSSIERPQLLGRQAAQRPRQHSGQACLGIVLIQRDRTELAQVLGEPGQGHLRMGQRVPGKNAERQRKAVAPDDEVAHRCRVGRDPRRAEPVGEQSPGFRGLQPIQCEVPGAVPGDQAGQPSAAGHDDCAALTARQQRHDLGGVGGVVQHQQHPPVHHQAAEQRGLGVQVGRTSVYAQRVEESSQRDLGWHRRRLGGEPPQVDEQLPVREACRVAVRPVQREPRLADAARTGDREDPRMAPEAFQRIVPADERRRRPWQLPWHHNGFREHDRVKGSESSVDYHAVLGR
ncbi:hypothetical protein [Lentzea indica]|uniref:hypothetical protein n=1 Tax=Lentzea indica TaxID=2604800 RepID=UPI00143A0A9A|nr:hypothetical protein [Lentzea indica]